MRALPSDASTLATTAGSRGRSSGIALAMSSKSSCLCRAEEGSNKQVKKDELFKKTYLNPLEMKDKVQSNEKEESFKAEGGKLYDIL